MLNFRKLKQDYSPTILKEGKELFQTEKIVSAKILNLTPNAVRLACQVVGKFDKKYQCEIEIDRKDSMTVDSDCDCPYQYDCQHLAGVLFYLEEHLNTIIIDFSKKTDIEEIDQLDEESKATLKETIETAKTKEAARRGKKQQKELLQEYVTASKMLGRSPFFLPDEELKADKADLAVIFTSVPKKTNTTNPGVEIQIALRLPFRSKPLHIPHLKDFLDAVRYGETIYLGNKRYFFSLDSFGGADREILKMIMDFSWFPVTKEETHTRVGIVDLEAFGTILARGQELAMTQSGSREGDQQEIPCIYNGTLEEPVQFSLSPALLQFDIEYIEVPAPKMLLNPTVILDNVVVNLEQANFFECAKPGVFYLNTYYRFQPHVRRRHLRNLVAIRDVTIPEPLFGTFVENALGEMMRFAEVRGREVLEKFVTMPHTTKLTAECELTYLNGELEATIHFLYDSIKVPAQATQLKAKDVEAFITDEGILARNLTDEQQIIEDIFQGFVFNIAQGVFVCKTEKKIVEFMTEVVPQNQDRVLFKCPENLLEQFIYDDTTFDLSLKETKHVDRYEVDLKVNGYLNGVTLELLWECLTSRRTFIELSQSKGKAKKKGAAVSGKASKILVLDLDKLEPVVQIFDELGIGKLDDHSEERPLWSLASIDEKQFEGLPINFSMSKKLKDIQQQMMGLAPFTPTAIPKDINAKLRDYQNDGVHWLERLREMHLSGILADDMGLGKTLQAITAVTQQKAKDKNSLSIVVCPTSLVYNWQEEFNKFNSKIKTLVIDGTPAQRKRLIDSKDKYDVIITSYTLLQKDIEQYAETNFTYSILDEAQHIKNRTTRNAKSVKELKARNRLILTGTPIENSLEELWSLFDYLMPGLLSSYDRFVEKYVRNPGQGTNKNLEKLRRKVTPFIMRRMKKDVLKDLPPVSDIVYHCHLSDQQRELYQSYAKSAREELSQLVKKEGFDKVQIHVLATLTRLKQICCHPAIFAKERPEEGDSSKYDMLMELLSNLIEGKHKTVIFSQYTRMLSIMREDLRQKGIRFEYLDGSTKDRLGVVKKFNEDPNVPIFLVSLKAGGSGLNLTGADTVIHYDMWWNPAVENQATDRVHRLGQLKSVSSYKLVTKGTIEEKIVELQDRKRGLVQKVVDCDEEAISKLTWEEVLELLQA